VKVSQIEPEGARKAIARAFWLQESPKSAAVKVTACKGNAAYPQAAQR